MGYKSLYHVSAKRHEIELDSSKVYPINILDNITQSCHLSNKEIGQPYNLSAILS